MKFYLSRSMLRMITIVLFLGIFTSAIASNAPDAVQKKIAALEASLDGRIGISAVNTGDGMHIEYHADERFPFCSTFKVMGVAAVLKQSMSEQDLLKQNIRYTQADVDASGYAPITTKHISNGMTVSELCGAALMHSDNAAINLVVKKLGGLDSVNQFARSIGDNTFRLDRWEPELNSAIPGDLRDTSTPTAMGESLRKIVLGDVLAPAQRDQMQAWLKQNTTGDKRIRAGMPKGWIVGDKTGTCGHYGTTNDIAVIWPPKCAPIVLAIYLTQNKADAATRDDVLAAATRIVVEAFQKTDQCFASG